MNWYDEKQLGVEPRATSPSIGLGYKTYSKKTTGNLPPPKKF